MLEMMGVSKHVTPEVPFVQSFYQGKRHKPTSIIIRMTNLPSAQGAALEIANFWHSSSFLLETGHYVVDQATTYRTTPDDHVVGLGKVGEKNALRITMCGELGNHEETEVLRRTAKLVVDLGLAFRIQLRHIDDQELSKWQRFRSRRRGGIYVEDPYGLWSYERFEKFVLDELDARLT